MHLKMTRIAMAGLTAIAIMLTGTPSTAAPAASTASGTIDDFAPGWIWSGMTEYDDPGLYGGRAHAGGPGGYGSFTFSGTGVDVVGVSAPNIQMDGRTHRAGSLKVSVDGKVIATTSMHGATTSYNFQAGHVAGLTQGIHVLEVEPVDGWVIVNYIQVTNPEAPASTADSPSTQAASTPAVTRLGTPVFMMRAGGTSVGDWTADTGAYGGQVATSSDNVSTANVVDPAPEAVYQAERWGAFGYVVPDLTPGTVYNVRLDFAETYYWRTTMRRFDVAINGNTVLQDFDIFAAAGGKDRAISEVFHATADEQGHIAIAFIAGKADNPQVCAIAVYKP